MKLFTKILSLLLVVAMIALPLCACEKDEPATSGNTSGTAVSSEVAGDEPAIPEGTRFDDTEIRFIVSDGDEATGSLPSRSIDIDEDADMAFSVNQAIKTRNQTIEDKLGVDIVLKQVVDQGAMTAELQPILLAGTDEYDVVGAYEYYDIGLTLDSTAGTFLNYNKIADEEMFIDVTKPYWDENLYNELAYKGAAYWITGDLSQTWVGSIFVSFVNARIWGLYANQIKAITGTDDIYEIINTGKWTLDLWLELSKMAYVDENGDEKVDVDDQLGFLTYNTMLSNIMADGLAAGSHVTYTSWVDGVPTVDFFNDHSVKFAEKLNALYNESKACKMEWMDEKYILDVFAEGKALMTVNLLHNTEIYLADMTDDYYVVPMPKLDEQQTEYYTINHDNVTLYGIPASCSNVGATTATLELMGYYSYKLVTPQYYDVALKERYTRDEKAAAMIDKIRDSLFSDFTVLWTGQLGSPTHFFRTNISKRFASTAKGKQKQWENSLAKLLEKVENSLYIEM